MTLTRRIFPITFCALVLCCTLAGTARAGFFGGDEDKSGLDFNRGYDINTVSSISGRVTAAPRLAEKEFVIIEIRSGKETLNVSAGPGRFWDKKGIAVKLNDEITVKGSRAQGKDGKSYLLAQKLVNRSTGAQLELRNDHGEAAWSATNMNGTNGMRNQGGDMMRGGGGMMRGGGGGMMRH